MTDEPIPYRKGEPAPAGNYILGKMIDGDGKDLGTFWMKADELKQNSIQHQNLDGLLPMLRWTWRHLRKHLTHINSFEAWELGFMRDGHPEKEIALWVRATYAYLKFMHLNRGANAPGIYAGVVNLMNGRDDQIKPKWVAKKLEEYMRNPPKLLADVSKFSADGHLQTSDSYLR